MLRFNAHTVGIYYSNIVEGYNNTTVLALHLAAGTAVLHVVGKVSVHERVLAELADDCGVNAGLCVGGQIAEVADLRAP